MKRSKTEDPEDLSAQSDVTIYDMDIGDLAPVYFLGERIFTSTESVNLYRTWDSFEVTGYYNSDPEYCLVARDCTGEVVGFALGTMVEKDRAAFGYLAWLGVTPEYQGKGVADELLRAFEKRMRQDNVGILLADTEGTNLRALNFFEGQGFSVSGAHVWLNKPLSPGNGEQD